MTDRTHPDSGRITTSGDVLANLHDEIDRLNDLLGKANALCRIRSDRVAELQGTRKVLWNLLGECLPLLKVDAQWSTDYESKEAIEALIVRIENARGAVQAEELPQRGGNERTVTWACPVCCASVETTP